MLKRVLQSGWRITIGSLVAALCGVALLAAPSTTLAAGGCYRVTSQANPNGFQVIDVSSYVNDFEIFSPSQWWVIVGWRSDVSVQLVDTGRSSIFVGDELEQYRYDLTPNTVFSVTAIPSAANYWYVWSSQSGGASYQVDICSAHFAVTPTATPAPTGTVSPTDTPTVTPTVVATASPTVTPTASPTPIPTFTGFNDYVPDQRGFIIFAVSLGLHLVEIWLFFKPR